MKRTSSTKGRIAALVAAAGIGAIAAFVACTDNSTPPPQCLASLTSASAVAAAGQSVAVTLSVANLDDDSSSSLVVIWSATGGGAFDKPSTTTSLLTQTDPYGNPAGVAGSATDTFHVKGPDGDYTLRAAIQAGGGCPPATYETPLRVSGSLPDAGTDAGGADATADADADVDGGAPVDAGDASDAPTAADAPSDG